jgi:prepilin-type N-terminal cleavage/methylation domain-containing protein/prepilin-type processing-associated H-X9-DG protein
MKRLSFQGRSCGFTLLEVLVVVAIVAIFFLLIIPTATPTHPRDRAPDVQCMSNLKQNTLGIVMWMSDHNEKFPWQVTTTNGGSLEQITSGRVAPHFQALSNYPANPRFLICPTDKKRHAGTNWSELQDTQISYFANLDAATNNPASVVLVGDRHLEANGTAVTSGLFTWTTNLAMRWTRELHGTLPQPTGNLGFADGHVQRVTDLTGTFQKQAEETDRLAVP